MAASKRLFQSNLEAFWFYRFLSIIYDQTTIFGGWTPEVRDDGLEPANLCDRQLKVVDVGGGTGFSTLGVVKHVDAKNVTILDQSPHQLARAKAKAALKDCTIIQGDAQDLPFPTDYADRYVSCGSLEYWPDPQQGIREAYRVLKPGGVACIIGPVRPTFWLSKIFADLWMLFPEENDYIEWFKIAGFDDVKLKRIGPSWFRGVRRHGLIMGCSTTGVKRAPGDSPLQVGVKKEEKVNNPPKGNPITRLFGFIYLFIVGNLSPLYFALVVIYMMMKDKIVPKGRPL